MMNLVVVLLLSLFAGFGVVVVNGNDSHPILTWLVKDRGGYVSSKIEYKGFGIFATDDLEKGELVMKIPGDTPMRPDGYDHIFKHTDKMEATTEDHCLIAEDMAEEYYLKKEQSTHWPYLKHVFEVYPHQEVPIGWSKAGKDLLWDIAGGDDTVHYEIDPPEPPSGTYLEDCIPAQDAEDMEWYNQFPDIVEASYRIVRARGWEYEMVPAYDMFNHRNGYYKNLERANHPRDSGGEYIIVANRDVKAGEQLHISYSDCNANDPTCYGIGWKYVTPGIFMDFGFVEQYPRRWNFRGGSNSPRRILFEEQEESEGSSKIVVKWFEDRIPTKKNLSWMKQQISRLRGMGIEERIKSLEVDYEARLSKEYWEALVEALERAVAAANSEKADDASTAEPTVEL